MEPFVIENVIDDWTFIHRMNAEKNKEELQSNKDAASVNDHGNREEHQNEKANDCISEGISKDVPDSNFKEPKSHIC